MASVPVGSARPRVVAHVAVSLDGATTGFPIDIGQFYALAGTWHEDVTLAGADTILAQEDQLSVAHRPGPAPEGPLLAVVDSRHRVRAWDALRDCGHWSGVVALRAAGSSGQFSGEAEVREIRAGDQRVDLAAALAALSERHGARVVRIDSGGTLIGALLQRGLVDELSLLVHPHLAGAAGPPRWLGPEPIRAPALTLIAAEALDGGVAWLRYRAV